MAHQDNSAAARPTSSCFTRDPFRKFYRKVVMYRFRKKLYRLVYGNKKLLSLQSAYDSKDMGFVAGVLPARKGRSACGGVARSRAPG